MLLNVLNDEKATRGVVARDVFVRSVVATVVDEVLTFNWSRFWAPFFAVSCHNFNPLSCHNYTSFDDEEALICEYSPSPIHVGCSDCSCIQHALCTSRGGDAESAGG